MPLQVSAAPGWTSASKSSQSNALSERPARGSHACAVSARARRRISVRIDEIGVLDAVAARVAHRPFRATADEQRPETSAPDMGSLSDDGRERLRRGLRLATSSVTTTAAQRVPRCLRKVRSRLLWTKAIASRSNPPVSPSYGFAPLSVIRTKLACATPMSARSNASPPASDGSVGSAPSGPA